MVVQLTVPHPLISVVLLPREDSTKENDMIYQSRVVNETRLWISCPVTRSNSNRCSHSSRIRPSYSQLMTLSDVWVGHGQQQRWWQAIKKKEPPIQHWTHTYSFEWQQHSNTSTILISISISVSISIPNLWQLPTVQVGTARTTPGTIVCSELLIVAHAYQAKPIQYLPHVTIYIATIYTFCDGWELVTQWNTFQRQYRIVAATCMCVCVWVDQWEKKVPLEDQPSRKRLGRPVTVSREVSEGWKQWTTLIAVDSINIDEDICAVRTRTAWVPRLCCCRPTQLTSIRIIVCHYTCTGVGRLDCVVVLLDLLLPIHNSLFCHPIIGMCERRSSKP